MSNKLLIILGVVLASIAGAFFWVWNGNSFSKDLLRLEVLGPNEAAAGEEVEYVVTLKNNGNVSLENALLTFEYPDRAIPRDGRDLRVQQKMEEIYPGREVSVSFFARLLGKEGDLKRARASVTYSLKNLQASYESEASKATRISSVPLNFEFDLPSRIENGQQFTFQLNYFSHASSSLSNLRLKIEYAPGFRFEESSPSSVGENEWEIGTLDAGEGGRIQIRGALDGQVGSSKVFRALIGAWDEGVFTELKEASESVEISRPRLLITQMVNGEDLPLVSPGDNLHYVISFKNISGRRLSDLFLAVTLEGDLFDFETIRPVGGAVRPGGDTIVWEARDNPLLADLDPGEGGMAEFWVRLKDGDSLSPGMSDVLLRNQVILSDAREEFEIRAATRLLADQSLERGYLHIESRGPIPPRAGEETSFVVVWEASTLTNEVRDAKMRATLAPNVAMTGVFAPENAALTYDSKSREVVWDAGALTAAEGPKRAAFEISFKPSAEDRGRASSLIGEARATGTDSFAQTETAALAPALTTASGEGGGVVQ